MFPLRKCICVGPVVPILFFFLFSFLFTCLACWACLGSLLVCLLVVLVLEDHALTGIAGLCLVTLRGLSHVFEIPLVVALAVSWEIHVEPCLVLCCSHSWCIILDLSPVTGMAVYGRVTMEAPFSEGKASVGPALRPSPSGSHCSHRPFCFSVLWAGLFLAPCIGLWAFISVFSLPGRLPAVLQMFMYPLRRIRGVQCEDFHLPCFSAVWTL